MAFPLTDLALDNNDFRRVVATTSNLQVVVMSLYAGQELGVEVHRNNEQLVHVLEGTVTVFIGQQVHELQAGDAIIIPMGVEHNVIAETEVQLYTIYSPPVHPPTRRQHFQPFEN